MKHICFLIYDFRKENLKLQPWRYVYEISKGLKQNGMSVSILTNGRGNDLKYELIGSIEIIRIPKISPFSINSIKSHIDAINPDIIIWWASPRTFVYYPLFCKLRIPLVLLFIGPIYHVNELLSVRKYLGLRMMLPFLKNALIPKCLLNWLVNSNSVRKVVVLTERNRGRLIEAGSKIHKLKVIPIGKHVDGNGLRSFLVENGMSAASTFNILYMGAATRLRGVEFLLRAFSMVDFNSRSIRLQILARGAKKDDLNTLQTLCRSLNILDRVDIIGGFLRTNLLEKYIRECSVLVMPFLLVHSDMPISIIEAFAFGKPVIGPDLDGIPEIIESRGLIYKHNDINHLKFCIEKLISDRALYLRLCANSKNYFKKYPSWEDVICEFKNVLLTIK